MWGSTFINHHECDTDEFSGSLDCAPLSFSARQLVSSGREKNCCLLRPPIDVTHADMSYDISDASICPPSYQQAYHKFEWRLFTCAISLHNYIHTNSRRFTHPILITSTQASHPVTCRMLKLAQSEPISANFTIKRNIYLKFKTGEEGMHVTYSSA